MLGLAAPSGRTARSPNGATEESSQRLTPRLGLSRETLRNILTPPTSCARVFPAAQVHKSEVFTRPSGGTRRIDSALRLTRMQKHACKNRCRPVNPVEKQHATARRRTSHPSLATATANCLRPWRQMPRLYLPHRSTPPDAFARDHDRWQVSWLAGRHLGPPSQRSEGLQWHSWPLARRLQLRGQLRNCGSDEPIGHAHRIPLASPCGHHQGQRCIRFAQRQLRMCPS